VKTDREEKEVQSELCNGDAICIEG